VRDRHRMIIVCPQCESRYELPEATVPQAGRTVRCTRCRAEWQAFAEPDDGAGLGDMAPPPRLALDEALTDEPAEPMLDAAIREAEADLAIEHEPAPELTRAVNVDTVEARAAKREAVRERRAARRRGLRRVLGRAGLLAAALGAVAALLVLRIDVVRALPGSAGLYARVGLPVNLRGLAFEEVRTSRSAEGQTPVLVVEGEIRNVAGHDQPVPRLRLAIRDGKEIEVYSWTALLGRPVLKPGETLPFRSRLAAPPPEGRSVALRFLKPEDMVAAPQ
jgi:predicted Zn finger-like uncharacterized protein